MTLIVYEIANHSEKLKFQRNYRLTFHCAKTQKVNKCIYNVTQLACFLYRNHQDTGFWVLGFIYISSYTFCIGKSSRSGVQQHHDSKKKKKPAIAKFQEYGQTLISDLWADQNLIIQRGRHRHLERVGLIKVFPSDTWSQADSDFRELIPQASVKRTFGHYGGRRVGSIHSGTLLSQIILTALVLLQTLGIWNVKSLQQGTYKNLENANRYFLRQQKGGAWQATVHGVAKNQT